MPILGSIIKSAIELRSKMPIENLKTQDAYKLQIRTLRKLLRHAQLTSFGEEYGFQDMLRQRNPLNMFKERVPLFDYESMHRKWWHRTLNGEAYVSWPGQVKYFALSSGTSGASSKYIPVTRDMLRAIQKTSIKQLLSLSKYDFPPEFYSKGILMLGGSTELQYNGTYYEGDLSGITTGNLPFWFQHFYKPGNRISKEKNWTTKLEEIVKKAPGWDIGVICGVPAWLQILLEKIIETYNLNTIHDMWPNLNIYVHGGVSFAPYQQGFEKLLARPLTYMETYLASEGFIAYQSRPNVNGMQLVMDNGIFFEFVPFNETNFDDDGNLKPTATVLNIREIEEDQDYGLLISTCTGAWRYLIGDTIMFTSLDPFRIRITGRTRSFINAFGEEIIVDNADKALAVSCEKTGASITDYTAAPVYFGDSGSGAHEWAVEFSIHPENLDYFVEIFDNALKALNSDYEAKRYHNMILKEPVFHSMPEGTFFNWLKEKNKLGGQNKVPRLSNNRTVLEKVLKTAGF